MKKLVVFALVLAMVFGTVVSALAADELTVWCWDPAFNLYAMEEAAKVYQKDHPDFVLNVVEVPWPDVQTKLITAGETGDYSTLPDIFLMQDNAMKKNISYYPDAFLDITDSGIDFSKFAQGKVGYSVVDGKNFAVPFDNGTTIYTFRKSILEEAGYTVEDLTDISWNRFIEIGKDVLEKTKIPMISTTAGGPDLVMEMLQSAGASLFKDDGSLNFVGNDALKEAIRVYKELMQSGVLIEVNNWDQYVGSFINGTVSGTMNGCWILASVQVAEDQSGDWVLTNFPSLNDIPGATNYSNNGGSSWVITPTSKNPELAIDFLKNTFAGSVEFYETILPSSGALATYLPAGDSPVYEEPQEFFGGQPIFKDIVTYAGKVPRNAPGTYYYEAVEALGVALTNVINGADIDAEIQNAQDTVAFQMGE